MSSDRPYRSDVMGWSPQQLADYLKKMNLSGCDKVVLKNSISGSRFVNLSDNDLQKFPKLHVPMVSKISTEINKKAERHRFLPIKTAKYLEPDTSADIQGWGEEEFDDDEFDNDYESPYSGDEEGSGGDYESPNEDGDGINDYEPPPSEPPEDLPHKLCPTLPIGDSDYIDNRDNHVSSRGPPPVCPRPPVSTLSAPPPRMPAEPLSSRRDHSPHPAGRLAGKIPPGPPQIFRNNKPGRDSGSHQSPIRGPQPTPSLERGATPSWRSQPDVPDPPSWSKPAGLPPPSIGRSNSSARPPPDLRYDSRREQKHEDVPKHNTFPLHNKSLHPRPGLPGPPSRHGDRSLPPNVSPAGSLPPKLPPSMAEPKGFSGSDRQSFRPPSASRTQELDPSWYVGKVTRGQAEGCLRQVRKDGAYLVRDSTRQQANQPYTLMVLYQGKVYNVQIRQQNQQFLLGTGLKVQETFPSVRDILGHYSQSPLLLIDAKNRGSGQQNQCLLSAPAGYSLTGQNWS